MTSMTQIKFCGIKRMETVEGLNTFSNQHLKYVGFVLAPSKRQVSFEALKTLTAELSPKFQRVGVFVNPSTSELEKAITSGIQVLQFHGDETEETIALQIRALFGRVKPKGFQIWKAIRVKEGGLVNSSLRDSPFHLIDKYLLDKLDPLVYGGTGQTFDWTKLSQLTIDRSRMIIAGGIHEGNVKTLMNTYQPSVIDLSSGIETQGEKDLKKMAAFLKAFEESSGIQSQTML